MTTPATSPPLDRSSLSRLATLRTSTRSREPLASPFRTTRTFFFSLRNQRNGPKLTTPVLSPLNYNQVFSLAAPFIIPGTCGTSGSLPAGIKAFPKLNVRRLHPRPSFPPLTIRLSFTAQVDHQPRRRQHRSQLQAHRTGRTRSSSLSPGCRTFLTSDLVLRDLHQLEPADLGRDWQQRRLAHPLLPRRSRSVRSFLSFPSPVLTAFAVPTLSSSPRPELSRTRTPSLALRSFSSKPPLLLPSTTPRGFTDVSLFNPASAPDAIAFLGCGCCPPFNELVRIGKLHRERVEVPGSERRDMCWGPRGSSALWPPSCFPAALRAEIYSAHTLRSS